MAIAWLFVGRRKAVCLCLCFILKIVTVVHVHLPLPLRQEFTVHMESHPIDCSYVIVLVVHLPEQYSIFLFCLPFFLKCIVASITHIGTARW